MAHGCGRGRLVVHARAARHGGPGRGPTHPATLTADMPSAVPAGRLWSFNDFFPRSSHGEERDPISSSSMRGSTRSRSCLPATPPSRTGRRTAPPSTIRTTPRSTPTARPTRRSISRRCCRPAGPRRCRQCTFDGSSTINISPLGPPGPVDVHVSAQPGTYNFLCRIHPGMSGTLKVVAADAKVPSQADVDQQVAKQVSKDLKGAWQADKKANHDAISQNKDGSRTLHVTAGTSSKDGKVALLEFFPRNLDAKPGDNGRLHAPIAERAPHRDLPDGLRDGHDQPLRERIIGYAVRATRFLVSRQPRSRARRDRVRWRQRCLAGDPAGSRRHRVRFGHDRAAAGKPGASASARVTS